ncbi:MAG: DUF1289 domain-containing protein [Betaproteobacteria bacterium]|nr:DUF1289 domain-containing protein [Betaproteobacteria bacterium]
MDDAGRYCRGCARTLDEIARWSSMSEAEHARVMAELPTRQVERPASSSDADPRGTMDTGA